MALLDLIIAKVKDDSGRLTEAADYLPARDAALQKYSKDCPRVLVVDVEADGSGDVELPGTWEAEFSQVQQVEWPVGEREPAMLYREEWRLYQQPDGEVLRLLTATLPAAGETVRISFTAPRTEASTATGDLDAVANLAAAICCETLANVTAQSMDPTISADVVNYRSKSGEFAARAKRLRQLYLDHFGIAADGGPPPAMITGGPVPPRRNGLTHFRG